MSNADRLPYLTFAFGMQISFSLFGNPHGDTASAFMDYGVMMAGYAAGWHAALLQPESAKQKGNV